MSGVAPVLNTYTSPATWTKPTSIVAIKVTVVGGGTPSATDWVVNITEKNKLAGASGYHEDINGVPVAYVSYKTAGRTYGTYLKPMTFLGKVIHPAIYSEGVVTVICHEIAEMLCDPQVNSYSKPDSQGREWLIEVCDNVFGVYQSITVNNQLCVIPDVTTPAFYDQHGQAPYDIFNTIQAPFIMSPKGYGYYYDLNNKLTKI